MEKDTSINGEITTKQLSRRILSKKFNITSLAAAKSQTLASAHRLLGEIHEFLMDYLKEGLLLTRTAAKHAYHSFHAHIKELLTTGVSIQLSEQAFDLAWGMK